MADETLVIDLQSDASGLQPTIDLLEKLGRVDEKTAEQFRQSTVKIQAQQVALKGVGDEAKKAGDKISATSKSAGNDLGKLSSTIKNIGASIGIGLGTAALVAFGKESFKAFTDAEKTAKILQTAVGVNGGLQDDFEKLIQQSKELQKTTIFSDDNIQKVQTMALQFGLTTRQVEKLLPVITDFASATGQSLEGALEAVLRGSEGMTRGLKIYGIEVDATGTKSQKLAQITDQLNEKFLGQAKVVGETAFGATEKLKNKINDLQEEIGGFVSEAGEATAAIINWIANGFQPLQDEIDQTAGKLDDLGKKILSSLPKALIQQQIEQFKALGEAIPNELIEQLKQFNFDEFNEQVENLDDKALIKKLDDIEKETIKFLKAGELTKGERLKIINEEIAARKAQGKLLAEQNETDLGDTLKALAKEAEARKKAQEAFRKFELQELLRNVDEQETAQKTLAATTIKDAEDLQGRLTIIEFTALRERIAIKKEFGESTLEEDQKIADLLIKNNLEANKAIEEQFHKSLEARINAAKTVKEAIEDLSKFESDLSKKTLSELLAIIKVGNEVGLKGADDVKAAQEEIANRVTQILNSIADLGQEIIGIFSALDQQQLQDIETKREALEESFDAESEALQTKLDRDIVTQAAYENQLKALRDKKAADEKKLDAEAKKIKQQQAQREKEFNVFQTILNTSTAIIKMLADPGGIQGTILSIFAGATGLAQLAKIISTPTPKFHSGRLAKRDSSEEHAIIRKDETILSPENSRQYAEILSAIHHKRIAPSFLNNIARMKIESMPQLQSRDKIKFPNMLDEYGMSRVAKKGFKVSNPEDIADAITARVPKENPYHKI